MSKRVKEMIIRELRDRIGENRNLLVLDSSKLDAVTDNKFRLALRDKDIEILTVKNALARRALGESGVTGLDPILEGPSTLVWGGEDIVALSKEMAKWVKDIKALEIKGGAIEGTQTLTAKDVEILSKSPGRLELIGLILSQLMSPGRQVLGALLGPGGYLAGQIKTIADKESAGESEAVAEEASAGE